MENKKIPIAFAGTASIGSPLLHQLYLDERFEIKAVITQVDRPSGRKMLLKPSAIKEKAIELNLPVFQPEKINSEESLEYLKSLDLEVIIVIAYGQLFSESLLNLTPIGCLNIHGSILPKYRGASPIQHAVLNQDTETGISLMKMTKGMDEGPVFDIFKIKIKKEDDSISVFNKLSELTAEKIPGAIFDAIVQKKEPIPQDSSKATYCKKIKKEDGEINWNESSKNIEAKIKGYAGWPGTYCFWNNKRLKILKAKSSKESTSNLVGTVFEAGGKCLVKCQEGSLLLKEVQLEGKKPQTIDAFIRGFSDFLKANLS